MTEPVTTAAQKYSPILFTDEKTFTVITPRNPQNDRLYAHLSTNKKDVVTKRLHTNVQSLIALVGESQVVDSTSV